MAKKSQAKTPTSTASAAAVKTVDVVLRKPAQVGDDRCAAGTKLGEVTLAPGVSLNYLVDAVRCNLATDAPHEQLRPAPADESDAGDDKNPPVDPAQRE